MQVRQQALKHINEPQGSRKAILNIPHSKVLAATKSHANRENDGCCQQKIIIKSVPCNSSKTNTGNNQHQLTMMMQQLELAYDKDVSQLKYIIKNLEQSKLLIIKNNEISLNQAKNQYDILIRNCKLQFQNQLANKQEIIKKMKEQNDILFKNRIKQFIQIEYINKINKLQGLLQHKDLQLKQLLNNYQFLNHSKLKNEQNYLIMKQIWQQQIKKMTKQINILSTKYQSQNINLTKQSKNNQQQLQNLINKLQIKVTNKQNQIIKLQNKIELNQNQINKLKLYIQQLQIQFKNQNKQLQIKLEQKKQEIIFYKQNDNKNLMIIVGFKEQIQKHKDVLYQNKILQQKIFKNQEIIHFLTSQKQKLLLQMSELFLQIQKLKGQLYNKQKVYEIKIEKVIDNKEQLQKYKYSVFQMTEQLKSVRIQNQDLRLQIKKRERYAHELNQKINAYVIEINQLKIHIQKKQKSFKWAVERSIQQDMNVNVTEGQVYKVSQVSSYTRAKQQYNPSNINIAQHISAKIQEQVFQNHEIFLNNNPNPNHYNPNNYNPNNNNPKLQ